MFTLATSAVFRLTGNWPKLWDSTSCTRMTVLVFVLLFFFLKLLPGCVCLKITHTAAWMASGSLSSRAVKKTIWDCVCVKRSATFSSSSSLFLSLSLSHTGAWHHVGGRGALMWNLNVDLTDRQWQVTLFGMWPPQNGGAGSGANR